MCLSPVKQCWHAIRLITGNYKRLELCLLAYEKDDFAIHYVPVDLKLVVINAHKYLFYKKKL
jgi:hypothetical protein